MGNGGLVCGLEVLSRDKSRHHSQTDCVALEPSTEASPHSCPGLCLHEPHGSPRGPREVARCPHAVAPPPHHGDHLRGQPQVAQRGDDFPSSPPPFLPSFPTFFLPSFPPSFLHSFPPTLHRISLLLSHLPSTQHTLACHCTSLSRSTPQLRFCHTPHHNLEEHVILCGRRG